MTLAEAIKKAKEEKGDCFTRPKLKDDVFLVISENGNIRTRLIDEEPGKDYDLTDEDLTANDWCFYKTPEQIKLYIRKVSEFNRTAMKERIEYTIRLSEQKQKRAVLITAMLAATGAAFGVTAFILSLLSLL